MPSVQPCRMALFSPASLRITVQSAAYGEMRMGKLSSLLTSSVLATAFCFSAAMPARGQTTSHLGSQSETSQSKQQDSSFSPTAVTNAERGRTYWKYPGFRAILDLWECPERGLCGKLHSIDPGDAKVRQAVARIVKKDPDKLNRDDLLKLCGYEAQLQDMQKKDARTWQGKIFIKERNEPFGITVSLRGDGDPKLHLRAYLIKGLPAATAHCTHF
jgi:hypothetical protein